MAQSQRHLRNASSTFLIVSESCISDIYVHSFISNKYSVTILKILFSNYKAMQKLEKSAKL